MGNCFGKSKKSIAPSDLVKGASRITVRLYGSSTDLLTAYLRFALLYKSVSLHFVPSDSPSRDSPILQVGSETVTGSREALLRYIDARFPHPPLTAIRDEAAPPVVVVAALQHRSVKWHLERLVRWAGDLAARGGVRSADPAVGSPRMEVKKLGRIYSQLLELMLEHAQMEERVIFPIIERADRGLCKGANEEHARDLPIMNGIKEDIKSVGVLDSGSPAYLEALSNLLARLKSLQEHCKEHFESEEREVLGVFQAAEADVSKGQRERLLEQCLEVMKGTHSHLLKFLIEGLLPREAMHYLDLVTSTCNNKEVAASMLHSILQ